VGRRRERIEHADGPPSTRGDQGNGARRSRRATRRDARSLLARRLHGALEIADEILGEQPGEAEAARCAEECRAVLVKMYTARIGPLDKVPIVLVPKNQLRWLSIDHRAGFVLSHIDGVSSLEMVLDVSGMLPLDCLRILYELVQQRVIAFR